MSKYVFNESTFWEMLHFESTFSSSGNVNDCVAHVYSKYVDLDGHNRTCGPGWEENAQIPSFKQTRLYSFTDARLGFLKECMVSLIFLAMSLLSWSTASCDSS